MTDRHVPVYQMVPVVPVLLLVEQRRMEQIIVEVHVQGLDQHVQLMVHVDDPPITVMLEVLLDILLVLVEDQKHGIVSVQEADQMQAVV